MNQEDINPKMRIAYVPRHARSGSKGSTPDFSHKDVEYGEVSHIGERYIFVRFDGDVYSKACNPEDLFPA